MGKIIATLFMLVLMASVTYAAPKRAGVTPDLVKYAIAILSFNYNEVDWTKSGKPRVAAVERILKADISAADRNVAWETFKTPPVEENTQIQRLITERNDANSRVEEANKKVGRLTATLTRVRSSEKVARLRIKAAENIAYAAERQYRERIADIDSDVVEASRMKRDAAQLVREAKARERGAGPKASRDCRNVLSRYIVNGERTWVGNLKLSDAGVDAIEQDCLVQ